MTAIATKYGGVNSLKYFEKAFSCKVKNLKPPFGKALFSSY